MDMIITMAGASKRFRDAGFSVPKYKLLASCHSVFNWAMSSLRQYNGNRFLFIVKDSDDAREFIHYECKILGILNYHIIEIPESTSGQAATVMVAKDFVDAGPIAVYNIDTHLTPRSLPKIPDDCNGWVPCSNLEGDHWSFIEELGSGKVRVAEKQRISNNATVGFYYFKSFEIFSKAYHEMYTGKCGDQLEEFVAPLYNIISNVKIDIIPETVIYPIGTPDEYETFKSVSRCGMCDL